MAQLSRPYQIGLAAVAVLAAAWLLLFQGHNSNSTTGGTTAQVPATPAHTVTKSPAPAKKAQGTAGQATGRGSASSLGSLGHAVDKARGAVSTSQTNAKQLSENSARASSETTTTSTPKPAETTAAPTSIKSTGAAAAPSAKTSAPAKPKTATPGAAHRSTSSTALQRTVEGQLKQGKVAVILFWDPKGAEDRVVHGALLSLRSQKGLKIAIDLASPSQVASFGTITRGVQVYGTPTLLFVNRAGRALTLTGLQDAYGIAQGVREVRHVK
ncbi:MAG TPA: hypothetical protein VN618_12445 [Solirubrobacteraceae bacterium]|nr:hypothetical protein [Solirubrobacteraceae bacterium]